MEYLSEKWFKLVRACLERAKELDMSVWIYDDNGFPSGFVGGKLLEIEENRATYLKHQVLNYFDDKAYAVYGKINGDFIERIFAKDNTIDGKYIAVYLNKSPADVDILNPKVVTQFINETHERYYVRFKEYFGKELVGFFTDEPQYFRYATPYSFELISVWKERYGENVEDGLYNLFFDTDKSYEFRSKYYSLLNELFTVNYYKRLFDWCQAHNCFLTGHAVEEMHLCTQMWGCAGVTPSYEFEHIPCVDNLGKTNNAYLMARQVGSVANQLGKEQVLTESFGCCGYDVTPKELKAIGDKQFVHGVNLLCQHLYPYSLAGQGKTDHPPCFGKHSPWNCEYAQFNDYFTRLGYLISNSKSMVNCVVISPLTSVYLEYEFDNQKKAENYDKKFRELNENLKKHGILYDILDEKISKSHSTVEDKHLRVGEHVYSYVVLSGCKTLNSETVRLLREYVKNGGKIFVDGVPEFVDGIKSDLSFLKSNVTLSDIALGGNIIIETDGKADFAHRKGENFEMLFLVNVSAERSVTKVPSGFSRVDLIKETAYKCSETVTLDVDESVIFLKSKGEKAVEYGGPIDITDKFT